MGNFRKQNKLPIQILVRLKLLLKRNGITCKSFQSGFDTIIDRNDGHVEKIYCFVSIFLFCCLFFQNKIIIIKGFQTTVFIFIVISTTFRPICLLPFFRCLSNSGTFTELWTTSFTESTGVACSDSVSHNRVQVLSIPVLLLTCCKEWTCNLRKIVSLEG